MILAWLKAAGILGLDDLISEFATVSGITLTAIGTLLSPLILLWMFLRFWVRKFGPHRLPGIRKAVYVSNPMLWRAVKQSVGLITSGLAGILAAFGNGYVSAAFSTLFGCYGIGVLCNTSHDERAAVEVKRTPKLRRVINAKTGAIVESKRGCSANYVALPTAVIQKALDGGEEIRCPCLDNEMTGPCRFAERGYGGAATIICIACYEAERADAKYVWAAPFCEVVDGPCADGELAPGAHKERISSTRAMILRWAKAVVIPLSSCSCTVNQARTSIAAHRRTLSFFRRLFFRPHVTVCLSDRKKGKSREPVPSGSCDDKSACMQRLQTSIEELSFHHTALQEFMFFNKIRIIACGRPLTGELSSVTKQTKAAPFDFHTWASKWYSSMTTWKKACAASMVDELTQRYHVGTSDGDNPNVLAFAVTEIRDIFAARAGWVCLPLPMISTTPDANLVITEEQLKTSVSILCAAYSTLGDTTLLYRLYDRSSLFPLQVSSDSSTSLSIPIALECDSILLNVPERDANSNRVIIVATCVQPLQFKGHESTLAREEGIEMADISESVHHNMCGDGRLHKWVTYSSDMSDRAKWFMSPSYLKREAEEQGMALGGYIAYLLDSDGYEGCGKVLAIGLFECERKKRFGAMKLWQIRGEKG